MIRISGVRINIEDTNAVVVKKICKQLRIREDEILTWKFSKRSIDARKKNDVHYVCQIDVSVKRKEETIVNKIKSQSVKRVSEEHYQMPEVRYSSEKRPVIIGTGPAGLFCGFMLAEAGLCPVLLERGGPVEERSEKVKKFWEGGSLDPECNVQFGEGGAGTFSDGKLNTLVKDPMYMGKKVLEIFVEMGADPEILYEQKPHVGTDTLKRILKNMRTRMEEMGAEFRFHSKFVGFSYENQKLVGITYEDTIEGTLRKLSCDHVVLAIGHSARDTFYSLRDAGLTMRAKSFAVGLRIEHPQSMIQLSQYGELFADRLPAAPYKVTAKASDGRGVYSFCMCPGGYVVNASSERGRIAVNGMSYRARDERNANSAMIVTVTPEDYGTEDVLSGVEFQRKLEEKAYALGQGSVPVSLYDDFKNSRESVTLGEVLPNIKGGYHLTNLRELLPEVLNRALIEGIDSFGTRIKGFDRGDAILSGVESRTSSPVRMERNEFMESNLPGVYPCGEGAGYAGGITSAAMDGIRVAGALVSKGD